MLFDHTCQSVIGHKLNYIYIYIYTKKIVCVDEMSILPIQKNNGPSLTWSDQRDRPKLLNRTQIVWPATDATGKFQSN
jgi:hypothetical protein